MSLGYLHLVFGLDTTIRSLRKVPFGNRHRLSTLFNLAGFGALLLPTFVVAQVVGYDQDKCFGSIAFRVSSLQLNQGIIASTGVLIIAAMVMATIIAIQLLRTIHLDPIERVSASRMVYYLIASAALQVSSVEQSMNDSLLTFPDLYDTIFHPGLFQHHG